MCECVQVRKFGKDLKGHQRYQCKTCLRTWVDNPISNRLTKEDKELIDKLYKENIGVRAIARVVGCWHTTVMDYLSKKPSSS